jgi:hypothetical protein
MRGIMLSSPESAFANYRFPQVRANPGLVTCFCRLTRHVDLLWRLNCADPRSLQRAWQELKVLLTSKRELIDRLGT